MHVKLHLTHILSQSLYQFAGLVHGQPMDEMTKTMQPLQWRQNLKDKVTKMKKMKKNRNKGRRKIVF